jgi:ATP-dependent RNA helicase RhlE
MLDMGFLRDERILKVLPTKRQNLMCFMTFQDIKKLAMGILHKPFKLSLTPENTTVDAITQKSVSCAKRKKTELIIKLITETGNRFCVYSLKTRC